MYKPPPVMRDVTRQPVFSLSAYSQPGAPSTQELEDDDSEVNIVGVLRLLTALEEKLGSLGPKVIDLLAQALAMEKTEANSSEKLLENDINCVLFETVKEKLKGQLLAGLVDYTQEKAFKNAIKKIASLIHLANEKKREREMFKNKIDPVTVPGVGTVDKAAIAKQIATALVMQGKTDVSQAELEQLINAVVGMAEASKNTGKPMTTANFLAQLTQQKSETPTGNSDLTKRDINPSPPLNSLQSLQSSDLASSMDGLSDSDLQTLLQNFKDLSTEEQHGLISYLKKLEAKEPERVERLRKFVNLGSSSEIEEKKILGRNSSPPKKKENTFSEDDRDTFEDVFFRRKVDEKPVEKINLDSDEEDYSFEDVFKAAKKNVVEKEQEEKPIKHEVDLTDAKAIIANLMENIGKKNMSVTNAGVSTDMLGTSTSFSDVNTNLSRINQNISESSISTFSKELSQVSMESLQNIPVNVSNLASIVNNVQQLTAGLAENNKLSISQNEWFRNETDKFSKSEQSNQNFQNINNIASKNTNAPAWQEPDFGSRIPTMMSPRVPYSNAGYSRPNDRFIPYAQNVSYPQQNLYGNRFPPSKFEQQHFESSQFEQSKFENSQYEQQRSFYQPNRFGYGGRGGHFNQSGW